MTKMVKFNIKLELEFSRKFEKISNLINILGTVVDIDEIVLYPEHELFMFSVLTGWSEMAKLFCTEGRVTNFELL